MQQNPGKTCDLFVKHQQKFQQFLMSKLRLEKRCKGVHCVDLGESFPKCIYLHKLALIQPRTSPPKICIIFEKCIFKKCIFEKCIFRNCIFRKCIFHHFSKILQIFGGLVLGCIKRKFCKKIIQNMRSTAFFKLYKICILLHRCDLKKFAKNRFEKTAIFVKFQQKNCKCRKICKILSNFKNFSLRIW